MCGKINPGSNDKYLQTVRSKKVFIIFCMYPGPTSISRAPCSGYWCSSVVMELNEFSRNRVIPVVQILVRETCVLWGSIWELLHWDLFSNNILFFEWVYCLFQKSLELQPNWSILIKKSPYPAYGWTLMRKRQLRTGDKTAYWMSLIWWDQEGFHQQTLKACLCCSDSCL